MLFFGFGSAGIGIANLMPKAIREAGLAKKKRENGFTRLIVTVY